MSMRAKLHWMTEAGEFFEKRGPVWEALRDLEARLSESGIPYVVNGGLALNAHGYARQTIDVDVVMSQEGFLRFRQSYEGGTYDRTPGAPRRFLDRIHSVTIDVLIAGELAGRVSRNPRVCFPEPDNDVQVGDLRTVSLERLIELKLVTWRFKDWGDVVELIRRRGLDTSFAAKLDPVVRGAYLQCYDQAVDPGYDAG